MTTQVVLDGQLGLTCATDRRRALHQAATRHPSDGFAQRERAARADFTFEISVLTARRRFPAFTHRYRLGPRLADLGVRVLLGSNSSLASGERVSRRDRPEAFG